MTTSKPIRWPVQGQVNWGAIANGLPSTYQPTTTTESPAMRKPTIIRKSQTTTQTAQTAPRKAAKPQTAVKNPLYVKIEDPGETTTPPLPAPKAYPDATLSPEASPCDVCGGAVHPNTRFARFGPWRRHLACKGIVGAPHLRLRAAAAALAIADLSVSDATVIGYTVPFYSQSYDPKTSGKNRSLHTPSYPEGTKTRDKMAWKHVDRTALQRAVKNLAQLRIDAGLDPARCVSGACGMCGVVEATGWQETDIRTVGGAVVVLCGVCVKVFIRHSEPLYLLEQKSVVAELLTGISPGMGEPTPDFLVPFYESGLDATGPAWGHLDPDLMERYRWGTWTKKPRQAPEEHREEAGRRYAAAQTARIARDAERAAEEAHARQEAFLATGNN